MYRADLETAPPPAIRARQLVRRNALFDAILPQNQFYARKYGRLKTPFDWDGFAALPFTTKAELVED